MYSMAFGTAVALGQGQAINEGGASRSVVMLGRENLLLAVGKRDLPAARWELVLWWGRLLSGGLWSSVEGWLVGNC